MIRTGKNLGLMILIVQCGKNLIIVSKFSNFKALFKRLISEGKKEMNKEKVDFGL